MSTPADAALAAYLAGAAPPSFGEWVATGAGEPPAASASHADVRDAFLDYVRDAVDGALAAGAPPSAPTTPAVVPRGGGPAFSRDEFPELKVCGRKRAVCVRA